MDAPGHLCVYSRDNLIKLLEIRGYKLLLCNDRALSVGDIIYILRSYLFDGAGNKLMLSMAADKNIFLLLFIFNVIRSRFAGLSVVKIIVGKNAVMEEP
jgi:hypothetical protein